MSSSKIKYRYALDSQENLIDIRDLKKHELLKTDKFFSVDFKQEFIPRLGENRQKHFAHKHQVEIFGSTETYLHCLGKKVFYNEYSLCLKTNSPFFLNYAKDVKCNRLNEKYGTTCCLETEIIKFDLTTYFTEILVEKKDEEFIPDLLLLNPITKEKIYIEIAVTHFSSNEKKHSGNRIIEFTLRNEDDIKSITDFKDGFDENNVQYYNFKRKEKIGTFCTIGNCHKKFNLFNVSVTGKCNLNILKESDLEKNIEKYKLTTIWSIVEPQQELNIEDDYFYEGNTIKDIFVDYIHKAFKEKVKVKNCYLCKYHATNTSWCYIEGEPIFCKFLKKTCNSNQATKCEYFRV